MAQYYYKIIGNNFGNFPYKLGLIKLSDNDEEFNTKPICGPGGLYYCEVKFIFEYLWYGSTVCRITIPPEAQIVAVENKFKADQINIEEMLELKDLNTFKCLLEAGANADPALEWASSKGHVDVVKMMLEAGADVHTDNDYALRTSCGHKDIVKMLLEAGADVHAGGDYALRLSSSYGHKDIVKMLLEYGADVHAYDDYALRSSSIYGHKDIVKMLLEAGADDMRCMGLSIAIRNVFF